METFLALINNPAHRKLLSLPPQPDSVENVVGPAPQSKSRRMQWNEKKDDYDFLHMKLHQPFVYVNSHDAKNNMPWAQFAFIYPTQQQIGLLGTMANESQVTSIIHAVNNYIGAPYFWNIEQFLRMCEFSLLFGSYKTALAEMSKGNALPLKYGEDWNQVYLDKSGGFHGFKCLAKWDLEYLMVLFTSKGRSFLDDLTTLANRHKQTRLLVIVQLEVRNESTAATKKKMHAFVLKLDKQNVPFLIDSSEKFCYQAVNHPPSNRQEINFEEAFRATTACYVYGYQKSASGKDRDSYKEKFREKMWLASDW